jgi:SAM-dependent methyltransferase
MEHFEDPNQVVEESLRVLKAGGVMYFWFGPPFNGPYGPHLHHRVSLPYLHHFFSEETVAEYLGIEGDPYIGKNRWSTNHFRDLFTKNHGLKCNYYLEEYVWEHLWIVRAFPDEFSEMSPSELVIRAIEVACVKDDK